MNLPLGGAGAAKRANERLRGGLSSRVARRWTVLLLAALAVTILFFYHPQASRLREFRKTSSQYLQSHIKSVDDAATCAAPVSTSPWLDASFAPANRTAKPRATFVSLVRERQLDGLLVTMRDLQWAFNDDVENGYDYVFLSEAPFTDFFKNNILRFLEQTPSRPKAYFGLVDPKDWAIPAHIDMEKAQTRWTDMGKSRIPYGGSKTYRQMCRFYSGPVYHHPLLQPYEYAWRIEPDTKHLCRYRSHWRTPSKDGKGVTWVERDPFRYMKENGKKYAWIIAMLEYTATVRSLMVHINRWRHANTHFIAPNNLFNFVSDDGHGYNNCHFWTNFEIVQLSFVRSEAYQSLFAALDKEGGFFYERWGDAPIRSIAASLMLGKDEVWHIDYAGYHHPPYTTCPRYQDPGSQCACDPQVSVDYDFSHVSCMAKWDRANGRNATEIIMRINEENGMGHFRWKDDEPPYVAVPARLANVVY